MGCVGSSRHSSFPAIFTLSVCHQKPKTPHAASHTGGLHRAQREAAAWKGADAERARAKGVCFYGGREMRADLKGRGTGMGARSGPGDWCTALSGVRS